VPVTDGLEEEEREGEMVGDVVKVTDTVGLKVTLVVTLGVGVPVKHSVGEPGWVEEGHADTVPLCVTDKLLQPDTVALEHWLTLWVEVIVPEEQLVKDMVGDWQLEAV